jgi:hypothetical protein
MNIYLQSIRVLAMAYVKNTGRILIRCLCAKGGYDWSSTFTVDIAGTGKAAEVMRNNLTKLQEISVVLEISKGNALLQGMIFDIKQIIFGAHYGLEKIIYNIFTDSETGLWMTTDTPMAIKKEILKSLRNKEYNPDEDFHNDCRIVNNESEALDWLYSNYDISPDIIGAQLGKNIDECEPVYHVLDNM